MELFSRKKLTYDGYEYTYGWPEYIAGRASLLTAYGLRQSGPIPQHVAFCMDGNRRFAQKEHLDAGNGHVAGFESMMRVLLACYHLGIKSVTVYAFSIENFNRSPEESELLFDLVRTKLWDLVTNRESAVNRFGWHIRFPGHRSMLDSDIIERIESIEEQTRHCDQMIVNICAPYTTRDDLATAMRQSAAQQALIKAEDVPEEVSVSEMRYLAHSDALDILVRTSGETRFSDFMVWEADSSCLVKFVPLLWPEFTAWQLFKIILKWQINQLWASKSLRALGDLAAAPPTASVTKRTRKQPGSQ